MDERYRSFYEDNKKVFPKSVYTNVKNHRDVLVKMDKIYEPLRRKALTDDSDRLRGKLATMEMVMDGFHAHWLRGRRKSSKNKRGKSENERRKTLLRKRKEADVRKERVKDNKIKKTFKNRLKSLKLQLLSKRGQSKGKGGGGDMNPSKVKPELVTPPKSLLKR
jgi:hypothetical protein